MTGGNGRKRCSAAVALGLFLTGSVGACNMLSGASDLAICDGSTCAEETNALLDEASSADGDHVSVDAAGDSQTLAVDRDAAPTPDQDAGLDASSCPSCSGTPCCAPNQCIVATGLCQPCSKAGGPCNIDDDCCDGLQCNAAGKCASQCLAKGAFCLGGNGTCCLGLKCSINFMCTACGLNGDSCNNNQGCCGGKCTDGGCVGNVP
ncbi:MAG: hypothetical protein BGO98_13745 [Myxococcales bacterium 68-20]|nr:hypothetical protein [Myxococcales bacterium]OJY17201.1 MAG: hypothetical protein BGO98_13745 [Myxococcales bacterium 68-20]